MTPSSGECIDKYEYWAVHCDKALNNLITYNHVHSPSA